MASFSRSMIRLDDACERYLQRSANEGKAGRTIESDRYILECLVAQLGNPWMHLITDEQMDKYCYGPRGMRAGKRDKQIRASSFNRYLSTLRALFAHAVVMHWIDVNPMRSIKSARADSPTPKLLLGASELQALLDACISPVERIACALGMNTGMRANDIRHLTIGDMSLAQGILQTEIRKTAGLDDKPITMDLHRELIRWLNEYARLMGLADRGELPNDWLLVPVQRAPSTFSKPGEGKYILYPDKMYKNPWVLVQRPLGRLGHKPSGQGFHTLRRSSARVFFESLRDRGEGRDHALMIVKDFLNHASTAMTERYLGLSAERAIRDSLLRDQPFISAMAQDEQKRVEPVGSLSAIRRVSNG